MHIHVVILIKNVDGLTSRLNQSFGFTMLVPVNDAWDLDTDQSDVRVHCVVKFALLT